MADGFQPVLDGDGCADKSFKRISAADPLLPATTGSLPVAQFNPSQKPFEAFGNVTQIGLSTSRIQLAKAVTKFLSG